MVQRAWIREVTLTMLLAIPLVLCITYKDIQNNGANNTIKRAMSYMYCMRTAYCKCQTCGLTSAGRGHINTSTCIMHALPIANAKLVDLHQQAGDTKYNINLGIEKHKQTIGALKLPIRAPYLTIRHNLHLTIYLCALSACGAISPFYVHSTCNKIAFVRLGLFFCLGVYFCRPWT